MEINNNEAITLMEIQIWNNKDSNGMFYYNNNLTEFKKVYFNFDKKEKECFLIKTKDNYIQSKKNKNILMKIMEMKFYLELEIV